MSSEVQQARLGDLLDITSSKRIHMADYVAFGIPFYRSKEVIERSKGNSISTELFISQEQFDLIKQKFGSPCDGDILLTSVGTLGVPYVVRGDGDFYFKDGNLTWMRNFTKEISPQFLYYWLTSPQIQQKLDEVSIGSTQKALTISALKALEISLPTRSTQDEIVEILGAISDRISLLRETNATLEAIAQALFKSWFVDFDPIRARMEGRAPKGMDDATAALFPDGLEESDLGLVPRGWVMTSIRDVVEGVYDGPHATPAESDAGPVFLGIKNLTGTALDLGEIRHIAETDWERWTRRVVPQAGDIVFSYEATLGFFALIPPDMRCCLGRRLALIRPKRQDGAAHFWFHQFTAAAFQRLLEKHTIQGATVNRIALKEFPSYSVLHPPLALQTTFDHLAAPMWAKIHENQAQAQTLATLRDTLLPRLISGQLRLNEIGYEN